MSRRNPLLVVLLAFATAIALAPPATAAERSYIVVLKEDADSRSVAKQHRARHAAKVEHVYRHALNGYAARISGSEIAAVRSDKRVAYVERDGVVRASAVTQANATWGLDRTDQRPLPLSGSFSYDRTGAGVKAYIVDTGLRYSHSEFGTRAVFGYDAFGGNGGDCNGHGTHVGGTVGGSKYGVAKAVNLVAVRVLDCGGSGTWKGVIAGLDWVIDDHTAGKPAVANMSLGGGASDSVDQAVRNTIADGVSVAVAAGNGNLGGKEQDACNYSPARVADAITIGATEKSDRKTSWSNYGSCVDFFAPGYQITSAWHESDTQTNTISGTSMATPHVAGAAALYLEGASTLEATPQATRTALYEATTKGIVTYSRTENNHLLHWAPALSSTDPLNSAPTASFTHSCTNLSCGFTSTSTDSDGTVVGWAWDFGDGGTASTAAPSHTYASAGTYTVRLTVTDDDGATSTTSQSITVTAPATGGFSLTTSGYKIKGVQHVDLVWQGASSQNVDIHRGTTKLTTNNDGAYTDNLARKGGGSYTYKVCEAGTATCSNESTVTF